MGVDDRMIDETIDVLYVRLSSRACNNVDYSSNPESSLVDFGTTMMVGDIHIRSPSDGQSEFALIARSH